LKYNSEKITFLHPFVGVDIVVAVVVVVVVDVVVTSSCQF